MNAGDQVALRLSVLDQSPVGAGSTAAEALQRSIDLARCVDRLGYTRFWMSEHHAMETLACSAPEIMLARIGAETHRIRIGSGGIMLPHYAALKVAEQFGTLESLYPGRVDLGIGRAPGGGPIESLALRRERRLQMADDFADQTSELLAFLGAGSSVFPAGHPFSKIQVSPAISGGPDVWMLGSSMWSAAAAAEFGLPYAFAHFFSPVHTRAAITAYAQNFVRSLYRERPEALVAVGVICADTEEEADFLASSVRLLQRRIRLGDRRPLAAPADALQELRLSGDMALEEGEFPRYIVGTPNRVREVLQAMAQELRISELVVNSIVWDHAARLRSYALLADAFDLEQKSAHRATAA